MPKPHSFSQATVLIVDDHEEKRYLLRRALESAGHRVVEATTGAEAFLRLSSDVEVILLDVQLPDMSGFEVCARLKSSLKFAHIPVIQMSASFTTRDDRVRGLEGGADGYLVAPLDPAELIATLGTVLRLRNFSREQSEMLQRERTMREALERANARLHTQAEILQNVEDAIIVTDVHGMVTYWNRGAETLTGWLAAERVAQPLSQLGAEVADRVTAGGYLPLTELKAAHSEWRMRRKDGTVLHLAVHTHPLRSPDGEPTGHVSLGIDTAERRRAARFEEQLLGVVSHDLRAPLTAMMMAAEVAMTTVHEETPVMKYLRRILRSGRRATRLIRDLLDFSQVRLGESLFIQRQTSNLHQLSQHAVEDLRIAHPSRRIDFEPLGDGDGQWDPDRLMQVVTNLVANAVTYGAPESPVRVRTRALECGSEVEVEVHNLGTPIPQGLLNELFLPLRRGEGQKREAGSIGLGLFIVDQIVRAHGGRVRVESTEEQGTTFAVRLPRNEVVGLAKS